MPNHKYRINNPKYQSKKIEEYHARSTLPSLFKMRTLGRLRKMGDFEKRLCQAVLILMIIHSVQGENDEPGNSEKSGLVKRKSVKHQGLALGSALADLSFYNTKVRSPAKGKTKSSKVSSRNKKYQKFPGPAEETTLTQFNAALSHLEPSSRQIVESFMPYISLRCQNVKDNIKLFLANERQIVSLIDSHDLYQRIDYYYYSIEVNLVLTFQNTVVENLETSAKKAQAKFYKSELVSYDNQLQELLNYAELSLIDRLFPRGMLTDIYILADQSLDQVMKLYDEPSVEAMKQLIRGLKDKILSGVNEQRDEFLATIYNPIVEKIDSNIVLDLKQIRKLAQGANIDQLAAIQEFEEKWQHKRIDINAILELYMFYLNSDYIVFEAKFLDELKNTLSAKKQIISFNIQNKNLFFIGNNAFFSDEESNWYFELWERRLQKLSEKIRSLPNPFCSNKVTEHNSDFLIIKYTYDEPYEKLSNSIEDKVTHQTDTGFKVAAFDKLISSLDSNSYKIITKFIPYIKLRLANSKENFEIAIQSIFENDESASETIHVFGEKYNALFLNLINRYKLGIVKRADEISATSKKLYFRPNDMLYLEDWLNAQLNNAETAFYKNLFKEHLNQEGTLWQTRFENFDTKIAQFDEVSKSWIHQLISKTSLLADEKMAKAVAFLNKKYNSFLTPSHDTAEVNASHYLNQLCTQLRSEDMYLLQHLKEKYSSSSIPIKAMVKFYLAIVQKSFSRFKANLKIEIEKKLNEIKLTKVLEYDIQFSFSNFGKKGIFTEQQYEWYLDFFSEQLDQELAMIKQLPELIPCDLNQPLTGHSINEGKNSNSIKTEKENQLEEAEKGIKKIISKYLAELKSYFSVPFIVALIFSFVIYAFYFYRKFNQKFASKDAVNNNNKQSENRLQTKHTNKKNKAKNNRKVTSSFEEIERSGKYHQVIPVTASLPNETPRVVNLLDDAKKQLEENFNAYDIAYREAKSSIHRSRNYPDTNTIGKKTSLSRAKSKLLKSYINFSANDELERSYLGHMKQHDETQSPVILEFNQKLLIITNRICTLTQGINIFMKKETKIIIKDNGKGKEKEQEKSESKKSRISKHDFLPKSHATSSAGSSFSAHFFPTKDTFNISHSQNTVQQPDNRRQKINTESSESLSVETVASPITRAPFLLKSKSNVSQSLQTKPAAIIPNMFSLKNKPKPSEGQIHKKIYSPHYIKSELIKKMQVLYRRSSNQTDRYFPSEENKNLFPFEVETGRRMCLYLLMKMSETFSKDFSNENKVKITALRNQIVHQHNTLPAPDVFAFVTTFNERYDLASSKSNLTNGRAALIYTLIHSSLVIPLQKPKTQNKTTLPKSSGILLFNFVEMEENKKKVESDFSAFCLDLEYLQTVYREKFSKRMQHNESFASIFIYLKNNEPDLLEACEFTLVCIYEKLLALYYDNNHDVMREEHPRLIDLRNKISHELPPLQFTEFREFFIDILPKVEETLNSNNKYAAFLERKHNVK